MVLSAPDIVHQTVAQCRNVAKSQVKAQPCYRVDDMRSITDQSQSVCNKGFGNLYRQRPGCIVADQSDIAQMIAKPELELRLLKIGCR